MSTVKCLQNYKHMHVCSNDQSGVDGHEGPNILLSELNLSSE